MPSEKYWLECEKRLRSLVQTQPLSFTHTLNNVTSVLECIAFECGDSVKKINQYQLRVMSLIITSKLVFNTSIVSNLDISYFLCDNYKIVTPQQQKERV